jgi:hypothetical protein
MDADIVNLLHIAPAHNLDFKKVTSPALQHLGNPPTQIWANLVKEEGRFRSVSTEELFGRLSIEQLPELKEWLDYIQERYWWMKE